MTTNMLFKNEGEPLSLMMSNVTGIVELPDGGVDVHVKGLVIGTKIAYADIRSKLPNNVTDQPYKVKGNDKATGRSAWVDHHVVATTTDFVITIDGETIWFDS